MFDWSAWLWALAALGVFAVCAWLVSLARREVSFVDSLWPLMFIVALFTYLMAGPEAADGATLIVVLALIWALRLCVYITWRNWGQPEDDRYQTIRNNNQPNFELKSLYIVFLLQCGLAWIVATPLAAAVTAPLTLEWLQIVGILLWITGMLFESIGDWQLARFKSDPDNGGRVMDQGLWRYTRHPNYFGEACVWWGFYFMAAGAGAWWTVYSPLLMTFLLLKVSGVSLLEQDIAERRPAYREYRERTNAFIPGPPKTAGSSGS